MALQLDKRNPLTRGLVFDMPFKEMGGTSVWDMVSRTLGTITGATWVKTLYGRVLRFAGGAATDVVTVTTTNAVKGLTTMTYEGIVMTTVDSANLGTPRRLWHKSNVNGDTYLQVFLDDSTTGTLAIVSARSGGVSGNWKFTYPGINMYFHLVVAYDISSNSNVPVVYVNGAKVTVTTSATPTLTALTDDNLLYIGDRQDGTRCWAGDILYTRIWNRLLTATEVKKLYSNPWQIYRRWPFLPSFGGGKTQPVATLTGTVIGATQADIVAGGKTIILTLTGTGNTWIADITAQRQNIINGLDSAQAEAGGWDAVVKATQGVAGVVRTSDTVVTITLDAFASYAITANETITATIPATALTIATQEVATPTFNITASSSTLLKTWRMMTGMGL